MKNKYENNTSLTIDENNFFMWICKQENINYTYILNYINNNPSENIFLLLNLQSKNLIKINTLSDNNKIIYITSKGKKLYFSKTSLRVISTKIYLNIAYDERRKNKIKIISYLKKNNFQIKKDNKDSIIINRNFEKYIISFQPAKVFLKRKNLSNRIKHTHNLILVANSKEEKILTNYSLSKWIIETYNGFYNFIEDGLSYSIVTVNDILSSKDFPRTIPLNSNLISIYLKSNKYNFY